MAWLPRRELLGHIVQSDELGRSHDCGYASSSSSSFESRANEGAAMTSALTRRDESVRAMSRPSTAEHGRSKPWQKALDRARAAGRGEGRGEWAGGAGLTHRRDGVGAQDRPHRPRDFARDRLLRD